MTDALSREIRGVLIPVTGARLLLPNATIAEVAAYAAPESVGSAPDWLLGRFAWRGWRVPLVSFSVLSGIASEEKIAGTKIVVLKAIGNDARLPFIALLAQGFPRLATISPDALVSADDDITIAPGVRAQVLVRNERAFIPDLEYVESIVVEAIAA